jgi:hypothetical protein
MSSSTGLIKLYPFQQIRFEDGRFIVDRCDKQSPYVPVMAGDEVCNWLNQFGGVGLYLDHKPCERTDEHGDFFRHEEDSRHYHYVIPNRTPSEVDLLCTAAKSSGAIISVNSVVTSVGLTRWLQNEDNCEKVKDVEWSSREFLEADFNTSLNNIF